MNLDNATIENIQYILDQLGEKLAVANRVMLDSKDYDLNKYDDLLFLYKYVVNKSSLSPAESQAFIDELRSVRKV